MSDRSGDEVNYTDLCSGYAFRIVVWWLATLVAVCSVILLFTEVGAL